MHRQNPGDHRAVMRHRVLQIARDRTHDRNAIERFADHARVARGRGSVRLARPHNHRRESDAAAVDEPLARVVVEQQLRDGLGRAVRGLWVDLGGVGDGGERTKDGTGRGEREPDPVGGGAGPNRPALLEQPLEGMQIGCHAQLKVLLAVAGHDSREVEDGHPWCVDQRGPHAIFSDVNNLDRHLGVAGERAAQRGDESIDKHQFGHLWPLCQNQLRQFLADKT
mmetsp:Transcript_34044/g.89377  ORF Transcript_34044/g.89377 Transcript_34044/m.89377 type:complete len:224 (+) Transcript_34044:4589-5260(+)